ncbi:hypothetical protein HCG49_01520 [Arenibacter sp. 6A1]|uniref:NERD domain-containing protein n=1 Tax=Arenibacter sp. 6A1 TaxID=2720391 RepID=UPI001444D1B6|nr:NERD domain-containing protein [Arenibacter sp. 6A1]NKI25238.1 hypothetical protein [Arenibacter sp. 6A1]
MEFLIIILILVLYGILYYFKKRILPKIKGSIGEYKVASRLKHLNKKEYLVLNDILLKNGNLTTQIDHVVICKSGIFVIETKNYKGWIHGHQNSEYWTQSIYKIKSKIRNPIKQNWVHVFAIKKILPEYDYIKYFPIVVFAGDGKLKNVTTTLPVIYKNKLIRTIKNLNEQENLSYNQMELISDKLLKNNITDRKVSKKQIRERNKKEKQKICPICGNKLIKKSGKYGKFFGCDNFPKCSYTLNIKSNLRGV